MKTNNTTVNSSSIPRDSTTKSPWQNGISALEETGKENFNPEQLYDVLVVGAGITGITTALLLQKKGKKCVIADAYTPGFGTTGGTTSHLNTFLDTSYDILEKDFGKEKAVLIAQSTKDAISLITGLIKEYEIDCDLDYTKGYLYAETDDEVKELTSLFEASLRVGIDVEEVDSIPVPLDFKKAIAFSGQAKMHPTKYLYALAKEFVKLGGIILEDTSINKIEEQDHHIIAHSDLITIKSEKLVYATHIPPGINLLQLTCAPYRSYVLGVKLQDENYPEDFAYDMKDPYHYFRTHELNGEKYLIVGGEDHKTGHDDPEEAFNTLEDYTRLHYRVKSVDFKWSSQYYVPADGLAYIGKLPGAAGRVYTATGYNGNGIIMGSLAGIILTDQLTGIKNRYADVYDSLRVKPVAGFTEFVKENADVAFRFIADRFSIDKIDPFKDLEADTGAIIKHEKEKLAVYKDPSGKVHALNPVCTHAKCIVDWNASEKSWDCPCHGGRFDINGNVLTGPPRKNLQIVVIQEKN